MRPNAWPAVATLLIVAGCLAPGPSPTQPGDGASRTPWTTRVPSYGEGAVPIRFHLTVPDWTPAEDQIYLYFDHHYYGTDGGMPLARVGPNEWEAVYNAQEGAPLQYRYNRNNYGYPTHERFEPDRPEAHRTFTPGPSGSTVEDVVPAWRWLPETPPAADLSEAVLPADRTFPFHVGIMLLDFYQQRFTAFVNGTLDRIAGLGIHHVELALAARTMTSADPLRFQRQSNNTFSLADLDATVVAAHQRGLEVSLHVGIDGDPSRLEELDRQLRGPHDDAWYEEAVAEWKVAMREVATWADENGVTVLVLGNQWPFWGQPTAEQRVQLDERVREAIEIISAVYDGNLTMDFYDPGFSYYSELDWLGDKWWWKLADVNETRVDDLRAAVRAKIHDHYIPIQEKYGLPVYIAQVGYASYDGAAGGYDQPDEFGPVWEGYPEDPAYPFDFQEQADAHHAVLAELVDTPWIIGANAFGYAYWDSVDKSPGFRAKPAEQVWSNWAKAVAPLE